MIEFDSTFSHEKPAIELCVVYDQRDGRIVHMHGFLSGKVTGILSPDKQKERERVALERAAHHWGAENLKVAHVPRDFKIVPGAMYRFDQQSSKLVEEGRVPVTAQEVLQRRARKTK